MLSAIDYTISLLGDSALEIRFGNTIDPAIHQKVMALHNSLSVSPVTHLIDIIPAYCTLTLLYNRQQLDLSGLNGILPELKRRLDAITSSEISEALLLHIPVCYEKEFAPDKEEVCRRSGLSESEVIALHTQKEYTVFMLGFLPGFPYMGILPKPLQLPRKPEPNFVKGGTIALAGSQTGIYPITSPGGWWQIGQTPLPLFNAKKQNPSLFKPGDRVRFYAVDKKEFIEIEKNIQTIDFITIRNKGGWL